MYKISDEAFRVMCNMWGVDDAIKAAERIGTSPTQEQIEAARRNEAATQERWNNVFKREPKIISLRDVVCADVGNVVWLETYYDGATGIEPFLVCIDFTQKPVIINGWDSFYNISEQELNEDIVNSFADGFTVRKFRFWNARPTEEQRKAVKWE